MAKSIKSQRSDALPSPQQIAQECRRIRANWDPRERQRRAWRSMIQVQYIYDLIAH